MRDLQARGARDRRLRAGVAVALLLGCGNPSPPPGGGPSTTDAGSLDAALLDAVLPVDGGTTVTDRGNAPLDAGPADSGNPVADAGFDPGEYPEGPYGRTRGSTIANLEWVGYVNTAGTARSTTLPYEPTSLQAMRTGRRYALIHVAEFY